MRKTVVLQHLEREGPGLITELARQRGLGVEVLRLDLGVQVPDALPAGDVLVVMGGPMSVGDVEDPRYPFLAREIALLRKVLAAGQPVLGVCLGAQLLAHAAGAGVYPNQRPDEAGMLRPAREVGFGEVRLIDRAREAFSAGLRETLSVLHWHGDTFDLPDGAVHLASSPLCANQAFRIGRGAFGLQFHIETDAETVRTWARQDADFVKSALGPGGPETIIAMADGMARKLRATGRASGGKHPRPDAGGRGGNAVLDPCCAVHGQSHEVPHVGMFDELRREHAQLACDLHKLAQADVTQAETRARVRALYLRLRAHIDREEAELYQPLIRAGRQSRNVANTLRIFAADTAALTTRVLRFFEAYGEGDKTSGFCDACGQALADLRERIRREEQILYPELLRAGEAAASRVK